MVILGVLEIDWNFIDFLDHPNLRQHGQEVVKRSIPGEPTSKTDCCRLQYCKISSYQIASFEGYSKYEIYKLKAYKLRRLGKVVR